MSKKVAVLFSSGLDSTYLIWKNFKDGNEVQPIYIEIENNEIKTILEKNRVELLWGEFAKEFNSDSRKLNHIQYSVSVGVKASEDALLFKQMPIWIFSLTFLQSLNVDEIQIGYVSNDDAISYLDDIQNIYRSYQAICEPILKPLVFPLTKKKKWQISHELPQQYLNLIFSCENASIVGSKDAEIIQYEPCCQCHSCKTIIVSNYYELGQFPDNYKKNIERQHALALYRANYKVIDNDGKEYLYWGDELLKAPEAPRQLTIEFPPDLSHVERDECKAEEKAYLG